MLDPAKEVQPEKKPISTQQLREVLSASHQTIEGAPPSPKRLRAAWCQICLETGGGRAAWCHNLGNIKTSKTDPWNGFWTNLASILPADSNEWPYQRAYVDHLSAANDFWLLMRSKFLSSLRVADSGTLMEYAAELRRQGYYTADPKKYGNALEDWGQKYDALWPEAPSGAFGRAVYGQGILVIALLAVGGAIWWEWRR